MNRYVIMVLPFTTKAFHRTIAVSNGKGYSCFLIFPFSTLTFCLSADDI